MILVFGKTGQVSMELQQLDNVKVLGTDEINFLDPKTCIEAIQTLKPSLIINSAAYTAVDQAEQEENLATCINGYTPSIIAQECATHGIPLIHISTDYVFSGNGVKPWATTDPTFPKNAYGRSKLIGEKGVRNSGAIHIILRTSWIISSYSRNFVKTMLNVSKNQNKLKIVNDQIGAPTTAKNIATTCLILAERLRDDPSKSGTYHFSGSSNVSWAEFATEIFRLTSCNVEIIPVATSNYHTPAKRPLNSRLDCSKIKKVFDIERPDWHEGLIKILKKLEVI